MQVKDLEQQLRDFQLRQEQHDAAAASRESSPPPGVLAEASGDEGGAAMAAAAAADRAAELEREVAALRRELVEQRDRADAFEQLLQQQAAEAEAAADAAGAAAGSEAPAVQAAATPGAAGMPGASPAVGSTPAGGGRPSLAVLAASPLLAGSRAVGEYLADVAAAEAATPVGERLPLLQLLPGAEDICCQAESHMQADELRALKVGSLWLMNHRCRLSCC